jgi:hypothetical protein
MVSKDSSERAIQRSELVVNEKSKRDIEMKKHQVSFEAQEV